MKKRLLSTLLVLCMVLALLPGTAQAAGETSGTCGTSATWNFDTATGTLTIGGSGAMEDYGWSWGANAPWARYQNDISSVVILEGITRVGSGAFGGDMVANSYENLKTVSLPNTLKSIGIYAFAGSALGSLQLPKGLETIEMGAFDGTPLRAVSLPDTLTTIQVGAFDATQLKTIHIPASVSSIGYNPNLGRNEARAFRIYTLESISVDSSSPYFSTDDNNILYDKNKTRLVCYPTASPLADYKIPETITQTLYISDFWGIDALRSITIPANVTLTAREGYNGPDGLSEDYSQSIILYFYGIVPEITKDWWFIRGGSFIKIDARHVDNAGTAVIKELYPRNGATDVGYDVTNPPVFRITFDREIASGSQEYVANVDLNSPGAFSIYRASDNQLIYKPSQYASFDFVLNLEKNRLTITPVNNHTLLDPGTEYYVTMGEGFINFADGSTNQAINKGDWLFTTGWDYFSTKVDITIKTGDDDYPTAIIQDTSWDDKWFLEVATTYNHELATTSMVLSGASYVEKNNQPDGASINNALQSFGFRATPHKGRAKIR